MWAAAIGDFDGDARADVITANGISGTVAVFMGNGDGSLRARHPADDVSRDD